MIGREHEVASLEALTGLYSDQNSIYLDDTPVGTILIYGYPSTGKSMCVQTLLRARSQLHAIVDCSMIFSPSSLYTDILSQLYKLYKYKRQSIFLDKEDEHERATKNIAENDDEARGILNFLGFISGITKFVIKNTRQEENESPKCDKDLNRPKIFLVLDDIQYLLDRGYVALVRNILKVHNKVSNTLDVSTSKYLSLQFVAFKYCGYLLDNHHTRNIT
jgi:Cdc6-like AAA superfamily ATPase